MSDSNILAIILLLVAITDTIAARYVLPALFAKNSNVTDEQQKKILFAVNIMTFVFAGAAVFIYITQLAG